MVPAARSMFSTLFSLSPQPSAVEISPKLFILVFNASHIAAWHTYLSYSAFFGTLFLACLLHFKKIVKNDVAGYPQEWFPSVSATIGDWYPERNLFQIMIAITSGPRIALVSLQYYLTRSPVSTLPTVVFVVGIMRTLSCGGWVYITSSDDHDIHDVFMIIYIVLNLPWFLGGIACTPIERKEARRKRCYIATAFFGSLCPMIYFFVQHKVYRVPGAYTRYSFWEWSLIFLDILYDSVAKLDFEEGDLQIALGRSLNRRIQVEEIGENEDPGSEKPVTASASTDVLQVSDSASCLDSVSEETRPHNHDIYQSWIAVRLGISIEWRPVISFLADVYLSFIFWSIFTSLIPTLFYFSVWELGIAGHELALLSVLSPILLSISPIQTWAQTHGGLVTLHILSFSGLASYVLNKPIHRLLVVSFATACLVIRQVVDWTGAGGNAFGYQGFLMGLGLVLSSLSKHANHSNNPVWPMVNEGTGGYNKTGLVLALLALYELQYRPTGERQPDAKEVNNSEKLYMAPPTAGFFGNWLTSSIALGGLIFSLHTLLSDSSTLIAWSWSGYENERPRGPVPLLHGSLTLIAQCLGLLIPVILVSASPTGINLLSHPLWFAYGAVSSFVMYRYKDWLGYAGGLNLALFLMSIIPQILHRVALVGHIAKTYFTAWLVMCLLTLASVWTVAYAFVPGGVYLRERTDIVLAAQMISLAMAFQWPRFNRKMISVNLPQATRSYIRTSLALLSILSVLVTLYRWPGNSPRPFKPGSRIVTAGIWTVHFGFDNQGRDSQRRVRDLIRDMQLDVVGLLETDLHRPCFGNRDLTRVIAEDMGYYIDVGPGPNSHTWGAVLLSKFPIINSTHHLLPSPHGELAPAIEATLDVYGTPVTVVVAHNGQEPDPLDRELQSIKLASIMSAVYPRPTLFLGYVVTKPLASRPAPYEILVTDGRMHDIDKEDWDRWCEYILYRGLYRTAYARLSRGIVTDTELQVGQFVLPRHGVGVTNETEEALYLRSWKEDLPEDHWFPMEYYGSEAEAGVNGHFYHVFNTPLYYRIPEGAIL